MTDHASVSGLIHMVVLSDNLVASLDGASCAAAVRLSVSRDSVGNRSGLSVTGRLTVRTC